MRVNFVTRGGPHLVSYRGRIEVPAAYFRERGWKVAVGPYVKADVHVFSKHWDKQADYQRALESPCPIFDVCDDHFSGPHGGYYRAMVSQCHVVTSSHGLQEICGKGVVIYEPYELPEGKVRTPTEKKALWFGHQANLYTLEKPPGWEVHVVANGAPPVEGATVYNFSLQAMREQLAWSHVVLLPQPKLWKSPNRLVEAVRAGRLPLLGDIPAYRGWPIPVGLTPEQALERDWTPELLAAQERVRHEFNPRTIGKQWFDFISAVATNTGPIG